MSKEINDKNAYICDLAECRLYLEMPIFLPCCGSTICQEHELNLEIKSNQYKCPLCNRLYSYPSNGLQINRAILKAIQSGDYLNKLDELHKHTIESLNELDSIMNEVDSLDAETYIYDYFAKIRNKIDLNREKLVEDINAKSDEIINQLKRYENEFKLKLNKININGLNEIKNQIPFYKRKLRDSDLKRNDIELYQNELKMNISNIQNEIDAFKNKCLMNLHIEFYPTMNVNLFGDINIIKFDNNIGTIKHNIKEEWMIKSFQIDENLNRLITASDSSIKIWDLNEFKCLKTINNDNQQDVTSILITSDSKLICGSLDETFNIWDLNTYELITHINNESKIVTACLLPNDRIALGYDYGSVHLWYINTRISIISIKAHEKDVTCLKFVNEISKLISGSNDATIKIIDIDKFECSGELIGHSDKINCFEMNQDGCLISASDDKTIKIWNLKSFECLKTVNIHQSINCFKKISNDLMITSSFDGNLSIFDLNDCKELRKFRFDSNCGIIRFELLKNGCLITINGQGQIKMYHFLDDENLS